MFWDNFKRMCDEKGLKPTPVLKGCGISTGSIGRWQKGASPYADAVLSIAEYLNCSTDILLRGYDFKKIGNKEVSHEEMKMIEMYRYLPEASQEFIYDSIEAAYDKEIKRKEASAKSLA